MWHQFYFFIFLFWIGFAPYIESFNVDTQKPIFLTKSSSSNPTYFGYSALLQKGSAFLGAPAYKVSF